MIRASFGRPLGGVKIHADMYPSAKRQALGYGTCVRVLRYSTMTDPLRERLRLASSDLTKTLVATVELSTLT